ncbi:MAG: MATE family efflux transporter [Lachnospiraceae bacterium]|nr:MATE family efflux transporter [Lachnospiraceae bacterium]
MEKKVTENKHLFTNKFLVLLILPLIVEQLLAVTVGFVDTLMISTVGEYAISGVALVDNINRLVIMVLSAFATGGVVIASQYLGRGDKESGRTSTGQLITLMLITTLILTLLFILFPRPILRTIFGSVDDQVLDAAVTYLVVTSFSYPFLAVYNSGAAIFRSFGNSSVSMRISLIMNIANVALNALFVFHMKLGVAGVGMATLFSRILCCLIMVRYMLSEKNELRVTSLQAFIPRRKHIIRILKIGIPSGVENGMFQIGKLMVVGMVATIGTGAIAANSVAYQIIDYPNLAATSIGMALITVVGQCMGAGNVPEAKYQIRKLMGAAYICDWISKGLLFIFTPQIVGWFSLTPDAAADAVLVLRAFSVAAILIWPLSFTIPNALRAAGDVRYTMTVSLVSMWICRIAASYLLVFHFRLGVLGVWIGMFIDWYVRGISFLLRYVSGRWNRHKVI